jgi:phage tail protein X
MTFYTSVDGDIVDLICYRHYGRTSGVVELVLELNRHLENYEAVLPQGVRILLPIIDDPKTKQKTKLWQ